MRKIVMMLVTVALGLMMASSLMAEPTIVYATPEEYQKATGKRLGRYSEAPELKAKVAAGELPALEERLPQEPLVVQPADRIGKYGGKLRTVHPNMIDFWIDMSYEMPINYSTDMMDFDPNVFKSWEVGEDSKTFTFHLRKGMKWSDGHPFTADDFMFYYEDIALNKELNPSGKGNLIIGGEMGVIEKIDDYTIKASFVEPYGFYIERLARWRLEPFAPKHYLKQFHPQYTPKAELDKLVKESGFDTWVALFSSKRFYYSFDPNSPTIAPFIPTGKNSDPVMRTVRNPYYWKVDTDGNQLPYVDGIDRINVPDREAVVLKVLAGDADFIDSYKTVREENFTLLKKNEEKGDYKLVTQWGNNDIMGVVHFNYHHEDPVLRKLFRDKNFRIALSVAVDRDELNGIVFKGLYIPSQVGPPDGPPYNGELPQYKMYTQYDPGLANRLLDTLGLKWDRRGEVRLRSDGEPLHLVLTVGDPEANQQVPIAEMYKKFWKDVGIEITIKPVARKLYEEVVVAGRHDLALLWANWGMRPTSVALRGESSPIRTSWPVSPPWALWLISNGDKGVEPPQGVKRLYEISSEFKSEVDQEKKIALEKEAYLIHSDNLWVISAVKQPADYLPIYYLVIHNRVKNVPLPTPGEWQYTHIPSWFIEE